MDLQVDKDQVISTEDWRNRLLKQSSIVDKEGLELLEKWLIKPVKEIVLKFKASTHDFSLPKYYEECGNLENTIVIAKTTKSKIVGGFTPLISNPSQELMISEDDWQDIEDITNSSFLFSLSEQQKFQLNKDNHAITRRKDKSQIDFYGTFWIRDRSHSSLDNRFALDNNFYHTQKYPKSKQSYLKLTNQQDGYFLTSQWQVYQVLF